MSQIDVDALLRAVDADAPCGPNLEYDPLFVELEQAVLGKPEVRLQRSHDSVLNIETLLVRQVGGSQALNPDADPRPQARRRLPRAAAGRERSAAATTSCARSTG